jgi:hypothetical protein
MYVKFYYKIVTAAQDTYSLLKVAFGNEALHLWTAFELYKHFESGWEL